MFLLGRKDDETERGNENRATYLFPTSDDEEAYPKSKPSKRKLAAVHGLDQDESDLICSDTSSSQYSSSSSSNNCSDSEEESQSQADAFHSH